MLGKRWMKPQDFMSRMLHQFYCWHWQHWYFYCVQQSIVGYLSETAVHLICQISPTDDNWSWSPDERHLIPANLYTPFPLTSVFDGRDQDWYHLSPLALEIWLFPGVLLFLKRLYLDLPTKDSNRKIFCKVTLAASWWMGEHTIHKEGSFHFLPQGISSPHWTKRVMA